MRNTGLFSLKIIFNGGIKWYSYQFQGASTNKLIYIQVQLRFISSMQGILKSNKQSQEDKFQNISRYLQTLNIKIGKSQRIRKFTVRLCLLLISEATLINSHQSDYTNMHWTQSTQMDIYKWKRIIHRISTLYKELWQPE